MLQAAKAYDEAVKDFGGWSVPLNFPASPQKDAADTAGAMADVCKSPFKGTQDIAQQAAVSPSQAGQVLRCHPQTSFRHFALPSAWEVPSAPLRVQSSTAIQGCQNI